MNSYGFWWVNGYWFIGLDSNKGQTVGYAVYNRDVFCPHQLSEWYWKLWDGSEWKNAGYKIGSTCNLLFCPNFNGLATCPNGAPQCTDYDSSIIDAAQHIPQCSMLGVPLDHLGDPIPNIREPNCTNNVVQNCPAIPNPICNDKETVECEVGILTCDNREGLPPVCSVRPGAARIPGTGLCTSGTLNICASCEANNTITCPTGQTAVCINYHSSSITIPAPVCVTNANVPVAPGNGDASCNSGTISCNPIPAPTCTANNTAQCTAVMGNVDARGIFTCTGRAPNESPFCSMVPGAVELNPTDACVGGLYMSFFCVGAFFPEEPKCNAASVAPECRPGTTLTCDVASGAILDQPPVCSRIQGAKPAESTSTVSPGLCSAAWTLQPCTTLT